MKPPTYLPIDHHFFELFEKEMEKGEAKVVYFAFTESPELEESKGKIIKCDKKDDKPAYFLFFENGDKVRVDRIIAFNGKPGPAYDEYDAYALAPLTCEAGYTDCNLD